VLVPPEFAPTVIDLVRDRTAVIAAGATTVPMASDSLTFPRVISGATPTWELELAPMQESSLTFGSMVLGAHTLRTKVKLSQELVEDATPDGAAAIERELIAAFALEVDRVALFGTGTDPQPRGIKNTAGVLTTAAVGAPANYDFLAAAVAAIRGENHNPNAYVLSAGAAGALDQLKATDNQPMQQPASVAGLTPFVTNLVAGTGDAFTAEWAQLVIGFRNQIGVRIRTIDASLAEDFSVEVVAWWRGDVGLIDPKAFHVASGITSAATVEITEIGEEPPAKKSSSKS
jgi:HK97 family phage major capsid protein